MIRRNVGWCRLLYRFEFFKLYLYFNFFNFINFWTFYFFALINITGKKILTRIVTRKEVEVSKKLLLGHKLDLIFILYNLFDYHIWADKIGTLIRYNYIQWLCTDSQFIVMLVSPYWDYYIKKGQRCTTNYLIQKYKIHYYLFIFLKLSSTYGLEIMKSLAWSKSAQKSSHRPDASWD